MLSVLVVDDQENFRRLMARLLEPDGFHVDHAGDVASALRVCAEKKPHVVLLDWILNDGLNGEGFMKCSRRLKPVPPVVAVTEAFVNDNDEATALARGVKFFFRKTEIAQDRTAFVRHLKALADLSDARTPPPEDVLVRGDLRFAPASGALTIGGRPVGLNPKELSLLSVFLRRPGVLHRPEHLWEAVWARDPAGDWHHIVDNRVSSLRSKLGTKWGARLLSRKGQGYLLEIL